MIELNWISGRLNERAEGVLGAEFDISAIPRRSGIDRDRKQDGAERAYIWFVQLNEIQRRILVCSSGKHNGAYKVKVLTAYLGCSIIDPVFDEFSNPIYPSEVLGHEMNLRAKPIVRKFYPRSFDPSEPDSDED